jgi:hypothetical protein
VGEEVTGKDELLLELVLLLLGGVVLVEFY